MNIINIETVMFPEHHLEGAISYAYSKNPHLIEEDVVKATEALKTQVIYKIYLHTRQAYFAVRLVTLDGICRLEESSDYLPLLKNPELTVRDGGHPIWYDVFDLYAAYYAGERIEDTYEFGKRVKYAALERKKYYTKAIEEFTPTDSKEDYNYKEISFSTCAITEDNISKFVTLEKKHIADYLNHVVYVISLNSTIVYVVKDNDNIVFAETKTSPTVLNANQYLERLKQIAKPKFEDVEDLFAENELDYNYIEHLIATFKRVEETIKRLTVEYYQYDRKL
jgi:hypothetical protein